MQLRPWAFEVAQDKLAEPLPRRWAHVQGVAQQAGRLSGDASIDSDLLEASALLHDVGYAPDLAELGFHPVDGARYLETIGAPGRMVHLVAHHSAARWDAEVVDLVSTIEPYEDEQTPLRDALWWADMTTGPGGESVGFTERMHEVFERYGAEHPVSRAIERSWSPREEAVQRTEERVRLIEPVVRY